MSDFDIPSIILDPQNEEEVILKAYDRINAASGGAINDFSPSSPIAALIEGQAFVYMELLWYLNQLPTALALELFRLLGVTRSPGSRSTGKVTFVLATTLATDFVVNAGYSIPFKDAAYVTKSTLVIPAGSIEGSVTVEATREGSDMNVAAFGLTTIGLALSYLQSIYNAEPINGGSDIEPLSDTVSRAQVAIRSRGTLVSATDYEQVAAFLLGAGSTARAFPLLMANKTNEALDVVHIFLLDADGNAPSVTACQNIQANLRDRSFVSAAIWVSPASLQDISIEVLVDTRNIDSSIADDIESALIEYLDPRSFKIGSTVKVKELEYIVRQQVGVNGITTLTIDSQSIDKPMPTKYTQPRLASLNVILTDSQKQSTSFYRSRVIDTLGDYGAP